MDSNTNTLPQALHDAENGKTGARLADYAPHIRELMADKARLDWLEKARPIVWALEQEGCAPYWIDTDFDGKHEETPEFRTCRSAIDEAVTDGLLASNPVSLVTVSRYLDGSSVPEQGAKDVDPFTPEEVAAIISTAHGINEQWANLFSFAFATGMRPSELCALRWEAIDWIGNTVQVSRAKVVGVIKTTKTRAGTRTIELTGEALAALTSQKRFTFMRGEYVFDDPKLNQSWAGADAIRKKAWLYTLKRSGVRYRHLYQTRHTFATANISRGCNLFWLSTQMGHKGPEMLFRHYGSYLAEYDGQTPKAPILIQNPTGK